MQFSLLLDTRNSGFQSFIWTILAFVLSLLIRSFIEIDKNEYLFNLVKNIFKNFSMYSKSDCPAIFALILLFTNVFDGILLKNKHPLAEHTTIEKTTLVLVYLFTFYLIFLSYWEVSDTITINTLFGTLFLFVCQIFTKAFFIHNFGNVFEIKNGR